MISLPINLTISGLIALFIWLFAGSFGIPGGTIAVIASGSLSTKFSSLLLLILVVYIASVIGDIATYEIAKFFSERFRNKLRKFSFFRNNEEKVRNLIKKYEFPIIFLTRFLFTGICAVTTYIAGFEEVNRKKFIIAVITGEFLYAVIYSFIGFFIGEELNNLINAVNYFVLVALLLVVIISLVVYIIRKKKI